MGAAPVVTEPVTRDREVASSSAAPAVPGEEKWYELATKLRRRDNDKNKDVDDDVDIQGTLAGVYEEGENDVEYDFEGGRSRTLRLTLSCCSRNIARRSSS